MMVDLLPCPFCGCEAEQDFQQAYRSMQTGRVDHGAAVYCTGCNANMILCRGDHPELSDEERMAVIVQDWNRRAPSPHPNVKGSLWDQLVVLSGYHITRPPTPDYEFVQVCNGDLRKMVELMGQSVPYEKTAGRWRAFEDTTPGYWGIELETAGDDDDAIMCPIKIHRDTVARIVEAHNDALATEGK